MTDQTVPTAPDNTKRSGFPVRLVGLVLVALAVLLHVRQSSEQRNREIGATKVRDSAAAGVIGLGLRATPEESGREPIFEPCSRDVASNILARLSAAASTREDPPANARSYDLFLLLPDRARAYLRVLRAPGSGTAFVALRSVQRSGAAPVELDCLPALVEGLGPVLDELDSGEGPSLRQAAELPNINDWKVVSRDAPELNLPESDRVSTAASLRALSSMEIAALGVASETASGRVQVAMSLVVARALEDALAAFAKAEDVEKPAGTIEGRGCSAAIFMKDKVRLTLMVAIPDDSPEDALVGFVEAVSAPGEGESGARPAHEVSPPARVPGLGAVLAPVLDAAGKFAGDGE